MSSHAVHKCVVGGKRAKDIKIFAIRFRFYPTICRNTLLRELGVEGEGGEVICEKSILTRDGVDKYAQYSTKMNGPLTVKEDSCLVFSFPGSSADKKYK